MKKIISLILTLSLCLTVFSGCGRDDAPHTPTGDGLTWDEDYTGPQNTRPEEEEQRLIFTYYPENGMNPYTCTDFTNRALFSLLYQSLFVTDRDYKVEPILCSRYSVTDDLKTYTFYLERATFSDGRVLTPEDVVASYTAARESEYYGGRFTYIEDISVAPDRGIVFQLSTPYENLPLLLDIPIVKAEQVEEMYPLGTGPYSINRTAVDAVLRKNQKWWCNRELIIHADSIPLMEAKSVTQVRDAFEFRGLSLVCANPGSDKYADYRCDFELWDCENGAFLYLSTCKASKVFSVPEIQKALTYAIDREYLADNLYRGFARAAALPASPLSPYYSQSLASRYEYDSLKFAEAVKNAGMRDAEVVVLVNSADSLRVRAAREIGRMLESCGLTVRMLEITGNTYMSTLRSWNYDLLVGQTKLSPTMDLSPFFYESGVLSWGNLNDPTIYGLCQQAMENHGNYYTLHQTVMEKSGLCPVLFGSYAVFATRGLVTGLTPARDNVFYYSLGKNMEDIFVKAEPKEVADS